MTESDHPRVTLGGEPLRLEQVALVARDPRVEVVLHPAAIRRIEAAHAQVQGIAERYRREFESYHGRTVAAPPTQEYGVTTGFGEFKSIPVPPAELEELQANLLLSHAVGTGANANPEDPAGYYPADVVRATLLLRLSSFVLGHSGIGMEMVEAVRAMLNRGIVPRVPLHGSVGSSGDLCPLAHLFVVLLGEGSYYRVRELADIASGSCGQLPVRDPALELVEDLGLKPPRPSFKEGLALINGATVSAALLALATADAIVTVNTADVAAALSLEAACGCARALDSKVHRVRGQRGQQDVAANLRMLLDESQLIDGAGEVQDPYSLRAAPVIHGASRDAIAYASMVVEREINAVTDNPLFFPDEDPEARWDHQFSANWPVGYQGDQRASYSAANFHGQPVALAADFLAIALAELASVAERRTQLLLDRHHNRNLPANLIARRGVNSGLMVTQYCAAGLVSENKILAHPASVDSIPTAANHEDHNSMATVAGRKVRSVLANTQAVLAIELLVATQAVDWRAGMGYSAAGSDASPVGVAGKVALELRMDPELEAEAFAASTQPQRRTEIAARLGRGTRAAYLAVRSVAEPIVADRPADGDLRRVRRLVESGLLVSAVEGSLETRLQPLARLTELPAGGATRIETTRIETTRIERRIRRP